LTAVRRSSDWSPAADVAELRLVPAASIAWHRLIPAADAAKALRKDNRFTDEVALREKSAFERSY
jgi:hypothetical protein